jgi:hypothetical protein
MDGRLNKKQPVGGFLDEFRFGQPQPEAEQQNKET